MSDDIVSEVEKNETGEGSKTDLAAFFRDAHSTFKFLGNLFYVELTEEEIDALAQSGFDYPEDGSEMAKVCKTLRTYLKRRGPNARQDLAVDYARVFLAAGTYEGDTAVPYESVYTSEEGILMQDSRDDVVRIYRENGLAIPASKQVPEDHLGFELEFLGLLSGRVADKLEAGEDASELLGTMESFIENHIENWVPDLQERVDTWAELAFYPAILRFASKYVSFVKDTIKETNTV